MSIIKNKLKDNYEFSGYAIHLDNETIIFKLKKITFLQSKYINKNLTELLSKSEEEIIELINFLIDIKGNDLEKILKNEDATTKLFEIIFKDSNVDINFFQILKERFEIAKNQHTDIMNTFQRYLLDKGYKLLELEQLSNLKLIDLSIKTADLLRDEYFFEVLISILELNKVEDNELLESIKFFIKEKKNKKINTPSAFDQLSEL
ncbi:MAG: hypothetical protein ACRCW9_03190 [Cetobacterium sp.]